MDGRALGDDIARAFWMVVVLVLLGGCALGALGVKGCDYARQFTLTVERSDG